jgi:hypothetical protein
MLSSVGLEQLDHDVYRVLLLHPGWDLGQIRQHIGVPEEEIRASLDRLTKLSLLIPSARAEHLIPVNPQVSLGPVLEEIRVELAERQAMLSRTQAAVAALASEYNVARVQAGGDGVERLNGLESVRIRLNELARQATSEVRAFMPGGALSSAAIEASRPLDELNLNRGVRMQTIYLESVRNDAATVDYATWFTRRGGQIRTVPSLPMRLILCMADLLKRLDSQSRFQAGVAAARRGWL